MIHIPKAFLWSKQEKNEVYKLKGRTRNDNKDRVSYQSSWVTENYFYYIILNPYGKFKVAII